MRIVALLISATCLTFTFTVIAAEGASALQGAAGLRPTPARPFGFRGDGSGRFPGAAPVTEWSLTKNVRWSAVVGRSYSSPILTDKFVFVTSEPNLLICLNRADGKEAWKKEIAPALLADEKSRTAATEYKKKDSGLAAATPITDGETVYAVFANGIVCAFDLSGKSKWAAYIDAEENLAYGRAASPLIVAGKLIVHMTHLYAFDLASGKQLWVNTEAPSKYGTPGCLKVSGADFLVTPAGDVVRVEDGKGVATGLGPSFHTTPVIQDDIIHFGEREIRAVKLNAQFKDQELWNAELTGDVFGSPLIHNGLLYTVNGQGELSAFNTTGKGSANPVIDARALFGEAGASPLAYASLTLAGNYIFVNSLKGDIVVLEATREARQVAKNTMKEGSGASPVFSGKDLFLRDGDKLYCIGE